MSLDFRVKVAFRKTAPEWQQATAYPSDVYRLQRESETTVGALGAHEFKFSRKTGKTQLSLRFAEIPA